MSKSFLWGAATACCLVVSSRAGRAQTVAEYTKRVDSLTGVWRAAVTTQIRADSVRMRSLPVDTIRVDNLVVLSDSAYADLARATAAIVAPELDRAYGAWATHMRSHVLVVRRQPGARDLPATVPVESGILGPDGSVAMTSLSEQTKEALAAAWRRKAEDYLTQDIDAPMRDWLGTSIPMEPATPRVLSQGRVDVVLAPSRVAKECALGTLDACSKMLGLVPVDDPAFAFYDQQQRHAMIEWYSFVLQRRDPGSYARCVSAGNLAVCDSLVHLLPPDVVTKPVSAAVHLNFVRYALMVGGDGAFDRLARSQGTVPERIAAAAKQPIDSVVRGWQASLMSSQSSSTAIDAATAASSIFWACLCGALALRSSRWR